ncbi:hypothetical protein [Planobispora rosea]|uniref:hypothetical protein n=1 Tax=Planobispora rosea TaxID=35762 RepID=UPI00083A2B87|nr:hypothetical protein [Planobispora rosea]
MPLATDRPAARHAREPGTLPRSFTALASVALAAVTGAAVWMLPTETDEWATPAQAAHSGGAEPASGGGSPAGRRSVVSGEPAAEARSASGSGVPVSPPGAASDSPASPLSPAPGGPSGFVTFVDAVREPLFDLPRTVRPGDARWFVLGHLTAGRNGCTPGWGGVQDPGTVPVTARLDLLRAMGGEAGLVFGGPMGRELASACASPGSLASAYRQAVSVHGATHVDFEVQDSADHAAIVRRAEAITALQREFRGAGRPLTVSFTLPATGTGLSPRDQMMVRTTREAGVRISAVNLLVPIRPAHAGQSRLRPVAAAVRAAEPQVAEALGAPTASGLVALTPVLVSPGDLSPADARKLVDFTTRHDLAWLSTRGATPSLDVLRLLSSPPL